MRLKFAALFLDKLRLSKPWKYKAPFLISVPYFMIWAGNIEAEAAGIGFLMSCCTIFGIAGFGYFMNDLSDREEDQKAGKFNVLIGMHPAGIVGLLLLFLALAILPWIFYFPTNTITLSLLGAEMALFMLYSLPPFRFKERGWLGVLCDALYAHGLPAVLAALTFYYLGDEKWPHLIPYLILLGGWQFMLGGRNILLHMRSDLDKDSQTGTKTLAVNLGAQRLDFLLQKIIFPLELVLFAAFFVLMAWWMGWWAPVGLYFLFFAWYKTRYVNQVSLPKSFSERLTLFLDDFYVLWIPLLILSGLVIKDWRFVIGMVAHLILFRNILVTSIIEWRGWVWTQRKRFLIGLLPLLVGIGTWLLLNWEEIK